MADQRKCPIEGCRVHIGRGHLMCKCHWQRVPGALRRRVTAAWRHYRAIRHSRDLTEVLMAIRAWRLAASEAEAAAVMQPQADPAPPMVSTGGYPCSPNSNVPA